MSKGLVMLPVELIDDNGIMQKKFHDMAIFKQGVTL